jgi:DNA-binding MarR family transcriptional regulator
MYGFVDAQNRRGDLAEALGFRLGAGRGKVLFLLRQGPKTLRELAEAVGADASYTTLIVDKLEDHGLVERLPHPEDRRRKLVTLTAAGQEAIATADAILRRPPTALASLPAQDLDTLAEILARLAEGGAVPG